MFVLTGVLTVSENKTSIFTNKFYAEFEQISNAISHADKDFLQIIELNELLKDGEYTHDTYEIKYQMDYKISGSPLTLACQPVGSFKNPGIVVSKEDFVRGALIAEAYLIHGWKFIHIVRPPQSGKTALLWCVHHHLKELARIMLQKSLYTSVCIQKGLNGLKQDIFKDFDRLCEHETFIRVEHLLNYKKIDKVIQSNAIKENNLNLIVFDEIQIAHNDDGNTDRLTKSTGSQWVSNNQVQSNDEFDEETVQMIENASSAMNTLVLTISATATAPNKLILDRLSKDRHPRIIQSYCEPNNGYEGFEEMFADGRIQNLTAGSIKFSSKRVQGFRQHTSQVNDSKVHEIYKDWLNSEGNSIAVQRVNCKDNVYPLLKSIFSPLLNNDGVFHVPYSKIKDLKIILLNGDKAGNNDGSKTISCDDFMPENANHWLKFEEEILINKHTFKYYNFHLSFRDKLFNTKPDSKTLILVCQGLTVGERVAVKSHVKLWVETGVNPNFLLQSIGRMFGYANDESKKFTGKIYVNLVPSEKIQLPIEFFYTFYKHVSEYGVSEIFPDTGYITESGIKNVPLKRLLIVRNPREINAFRVFNSVLQNNVGSYKSRLEKKGVVVTDEMVEAFREKEREKLMKKFDVISELDYRLKVGQSFSGFQRIVNTIGEKNAKDGIHPNTTNFWNDYGIMAHINREDLVTNKSKSGPKNYVNKVIAKVTQPSTVDEYLNWDAKYFNALNSYLVNELGQKPISEDYPVYIEIEKVYEDLHVPANFRRGSTFLEKDPFAD